MWTKLHWIDGPWTGRLALAARPRGGEWLNDEIEQWRRAGIGVVLSLLTPQEEADLDISAEAAITKSHGMKFLSFPIVDRQVPESESRLSRTMEKLDAELEAGRNVVLHCRQGIGRTGLVAACLLISKGIDPETALRQLSSARGLPVPETTEQRLWIERYASTPAVPHHE